jgi:DNA primase
MARVRDHSGHAEDRPGARGSRRDAASPPPPPGPAGQRNGGPPGRDAGSYRPGDPVVQVEREALKLAVQCPGLSGPAFAALGPEAFTVPVHGRVFRLICECAGWDGAGDNSGGAEMPTVHDASVESVTAADSAAEGGREWARSLREAAPDDEVKALVTELAVDSLHNSGGDGDPEARYVSAVMARVGELAISRQIARVKSRLQRTDPVAAQAEYGRMFGDLIGLEQRRKVLMDQASGAL